MNRRIFLKALAGIPLVSKIQAEPNDFDPMRYLKGVKRMPLTATECASRASERMFRELAEAARRTNQKNAALAFARFPSVDLPHFPKTARKLETEETN